jgi:hypothetical protein
MVDKTTQLKFSDFFETENEMILARNSISGSKPTNL